MKTTAWLNDTPMARRRKSNKQEHRAAKKHGGRTQVASGALSSKGDVKLKFHLLECKRTDKAWITITQEWLDKIRKEAIVQEDRIPAMQIEMGNRRYWLIEDCYI